jgi:dolichol-phosphate mannosyltransferase
VNGLRVLAVVPAYNESGKIGAVVSKITSPLVTTKLVVDDASTDGTSAEAESAGADIVLRHPRNRGVGGAIRTGIDYAREHGYDIVVVLSGDDQHEPDELPSVLEPILSGEYDFIQGSRWIPGGSCPDITLFRRLFTKLYAFLFSLVAGRQITDGTNGFRAFRVSLFSELGIDLWQSWLNTYELEPYLLYTAIKKGCRLKEVPITIRYHGKDTSTSKMVPIRDWWRIMKPVLLLWLGLKK